ncbi:protein translocase subunit SecDF [Hydrotalea sandarakina]|jgi:SecD/SecF fusion protein|uniref:Multifunctional fusion protein n=1 Tax=Hydrotalea sandarakina TaxID=1004304 RepID=A0A2W7S4P8_9BACT|nr:protein translocase subunit SecDF [Hydrotalea sandarakina]PZX65810.1 SecD/SecF fusion protein [Hydrotalea sandarakina]
MQLKGLVRFFTIALILICIYQLSFTWIVKSHESAMEAKAEKYIQAFPSPMVKYANNPTLRDLYADTLKQLKEAEYKRLIDSTQDFKIGPFGLTTYRSAKDKELLLGLDLQGGMSVTLEVQLDALIKSLADYTKDPQFNQALEAAVNKKANSGADLITLFVDEFKKINPNVQLAPYFVARSNGKLKYNTSNDDVINYLREQATSAFNNTLRVLRTRIDKFGVSSPNINPDPAKGIINVELAGITDPERVRNYLQSTANLQFFEVYTAESPELVNGLINADKALQDYLNGIKATDTSKTQKPTATSTAVQNTDTTKTATLSQLTGSENKNSAVNDSTTFKNNENPLRRLLLPGPQPYRNAAGKVVYPGVIAMIQVKDTSTFNKYMRMDIVKSKFPPNLVFMYGKPDNAGNDPKAKNFLNLYAIKTLDNGQAELEGEHVTNARQDNDERGRVVISMSMDNVGTNIWAKMTARNIDKPIAIVLDNFVYSAPNVNDAITTGNSQISGNYTVKEAQDLAEILTSGKLTAPAKIVQEQIVGPTLGSAAIKGGALAFFISFLVIFALMLIYYNTGGWVANIALILNLLFTIGILSALGFTLTAAGIAGLVLTVGMAVDTNVIIFERIKEELTKGKSYQNAINDGYKRSLAPVLDAHVTTLLTAIILAYFGLGPVLGFATTQIIGILLSLFCGILVSRMITDIYMTRKRHFNYFTGISRKIFKHSAFKFIEYRKITYVISAIVFALGIGSYFNGFDEGVEFEGGRSYTIKFEKAVNQQQLADALRPVLGGELPIIKTVGTNNQLNITTAYLIKDTKPNTDSVVEHTIYEGLKNYLPEGTTYYDFDKKFKQSSQTVQPSISDELKAGAKKATIIAVIIICLYIFIRFRDWRYSLGTIFSLMHDVCVTLAVFSFFRKIVPFPLEIDQHFIAAILTVIGFSMNDTVIVFDRIRENSHLMKGASKGAIINKSINDTLSRTIMTSLTVFLTLLILFIFGGEVTRGFSFAMLIGVITGTYSSIFVAAPILVDMAKDKPLGDSSEKK